MRYRRQEVLDVIGTKNQELLKNSSVTIVGIGALGTVALDLLARAGVGKIKIIDRDIIELNNLQRQTLFNEEDLGKPKASVAKEKINIINSEIEVEAHIADLDYDNASLLRSDLILDCTDNIYTRFLINDYAKKNNIPWIYSSVIESKGMSMTITNETPCFSCIFREPTDHLDTCETAGVINTIPHAMAAIQATEAIKVLTKQEYNKEIIHYDIWKNQIDKIKINKNPKCKTCSGIYEYLNGRKSRDTIKICGSCSYQIKIKPIDINKLFKKLDKISNIRITDDCIILENMILFKSGRVLVKAKSKEQAKSIVDRYLG